MNKGWVLIMDNTLEQKLKEKIIQKSGSIRKFAKEVGLQYTTILSMLNSGGISNAGFEKVMKICDFLNIEPEYLLTGIIKEKIKDRNIIHKPAFKDSMLGRELRCSKCGTFIARIYPITQETLKKTYDEKRYCCYCGSKIG